MQEECRVFRIKGDRAYISIDRREKCAGCKACLFGRSNKMTILAIIEADCAAGDDVLVKMPEAETPAASVTLYLLPLIFFVGGFLLARLISGSELLQALSGLALCAVSFIFVGLIDSAYRKQKKFMPVIIKKIIPAQKDASSSAETKKHN